MVRRDPKRICGSGTCSPRRAFRTVRFPEFFRVKTMTFPVWLNLGAPAVYS